MPNELMDNGRGTMTFQQAIVCWTLMVLWHEETAVKDSMSAVLCTIARAGDFYALRAFLDSYWLKLMSHSENVRVTRSTAGSVDLLWEYIESRDRRAWMTWSIPGIPETLPNPETTDNTAFLNNEVVVEWGSTLQERGLREPIKGVVQYIMDGMTTSRIAAGES